MDDRVYGILQARILEWRRSLLQRIFLTQESNRACPALLAILYHLSYQTKDTVKYPTVHINNLQPHSRIMWLRILVVGKSSRPKDALE